MLFKVICIINIMEIVYNFISANFIIILCASVVMNSFFPLKFHNCSSFRNDQKLNIFFHVQNDSGGLQERKNLLSIPRATGFPIQNLRNEVLNQNFTRAVFP